MKALLNLIKVLLAISFIFYWVYSLYHDDSCERAQQGYLKISLNMRIVKIPPYGRTMQIEGYNKGEYIRWRDFGVLFNGCSSHLM